MRGRAEQFSSPNYLLRMCLAGFGINIPQGINRALDKARVIVNEEPPDVPLDARRIVELLSQLALDIHAQIRVIERDQLVWQRGKELATRLMTISGIGTPGATALAASVSDPSQFRSGRQFDAWLGLTSLQKSNGGKERLGPVTKLDNRCLRKLLVIGMAAVVRHEKRKPETISPELIALLAGEVISTPSVAPRRARQT